jgi:transcriptional regulator with PAS, ATPase and Fis domain
MDIPGLCSYLLGQISGGRRFDLPGPEIGRLASYSWPGNVRELRNVLERSLLVHGEGAIRPSLFLEKPADAATFSGRAGHEGAGIRTLEETEKELVRSVLDRLSGNITQTAKALGISLSTLKRKLKTYGLR